MKPETRRICQICATPISPGLDLCPVCALRGALGDNEPASELTVDLAPAVSALRFENYEVLAGEDGEPHELGRGAMGITYKAFDVWLRCPVALKVINPRYLGDESVRLRFLREARAAAAVRHPNVASVFHLGPSEQNYFYAMEFVDGETLGRLIKRAGRLEAKLALEIATQIASGLEAVRKQNLVHRDIKPNNVMVNWDTAIGPVVKIIDLGLAKPLTESPSETAISVPGAFVGTPEFASPEQFAGIGVDIRSDLYSLGVTLWQMLIGQPPFRGVPNEVMYQHQHATLPLEQLRDVPQAAVALLEVLLEKDPGRRFQTPAELLTVMPAVKNAIETGGVVMKTIRVFISSNGDVQKERNLADRAIRSIAEEFNLPVSESHSNFRRLEEARIRPEGDMSESQSEVQGNLILCPYFFEYQRLQRGREYSWQIPNIGEFELVICILWSRLGKLVQGMSMMPDGTPPNSRTEYEIAWALDHADRNRGIPALRVYRNLTTPTPPLEPKEDREAFGRQWDSVQDYFARWEMNSAQGLFGKVDNYRTLEEFEEVFRGQFRDFLANEIEREIGQKISSRKVRRWKSSPFRGLNVFDFEHAPIFYGRTRALGEVLEALEEQLRAQRPFVLVVGASGSGKSSLIRAGVLPLLTQPGTIERIGVWRWAVTRPGAGGSGSDCFDGLAVALLEAAALPGLEDSESLNASRDLAAELREHPGGVAVRVRDALDHAARESKMHRSHHLEEIERQLRTAGRSEDANLVRVQKETLELPKARLALVVDQLEELFTSGFSQDLQESYISAIAGLARGGRVFVLATLRSDFYSSYQEFPELIELARPRGKIDLRPPTAHEIGDIIRLPAEAAGLHFEQDRTTGQRLDEALRDAASVTPESLPLLEHVLSLLYDEQASRGDHLLRWSDYRKLGELKGALAKHAEAVFETLQPHEQKAFPLVMRYLVTLGQGDDEVPNRRTVPYRDFVTGGDLTDQSEKSGAKGFVDLFVEKRLLVANTHAQGEVTISVAHEALLREWQRIKEWLTENREFLRMRDRLDSSLNLWLSRGKQKDDLLGPGLPLAEGEKLVKDFGPSLSQAQTDYVHSSIAEQKRHQRVREQIRYGVMAVIIGALIVAVIFGVVSYRQYRRAERAKVLADRAANRATLARDEAQKLINFMTVDLRDKLRPIGRLELLDDVNLRVMAYYDRLVGNDKSPEILLERSIAIVNSGDLRQDRGDLVGALNTYRSAITIQEQLAKQDPKNAEWQRNLGTSLENVGDVLKLQGKIDEALESYRRSLPIRERLADLDSGNAELQLDLSVTLERIGEVLNAQGIVEGALENYQRSLPIREKLVAKDPNNAGLQLRLSWSYADIGDILGMQGGWDDALRYYRKALLIRQKLATQDPNNTRLQRDLSICLGQIGYALSVHGDLKEALDVYRQSLAIIQALVAKEPGFTTWKRNLSISLERVGDILKAQGEYSNALDNYQDALAIRRQLANQDATNLVWQSDLAWSYQEIGDVFIAQGKFEDALHSYEESRAIGQRLANAEPVNDEWQSDLAIIYEKTGEALASQGKSAEALKEFRESLGISEKLAKADQKNAERADIEALALFEVGITLSRSSSGSASEVRTMLTRARDIWLDLKQRSALNTRNQSHLEESQAALAKLQ